MRLVLFAIVADRLTRGWRERRRKRHEIADGIALSFLTAAYARYGTVDQLQWAYDKWQHTALTEAILGPTERET